MIQRGQANKIRLYVVQRGRLLKGFAENGSETGELDGTLDGDRFNIQIFWSNDSTGVYNGKVLPSGRLDGEGYEKSSPNIRVPWHSEGVLKCAQAGPKEPFKLTSKITLPPPPPI